MQLMFGTWRTIDHDTAQHFIRSDVVFQHGPALVRAGHGCAVVCRLTRLIVLKLLSCRSDFTLCHSMTICRPSLSAQRAFQARTVAALLTILYTAQKALVLDLEGVLGRLVDPVRISLYWTRSD